MPADHTATGRGRRERRTVENREFDAFARRIVRAYARRVADGDVEALVALRQLSSVLEDATKDAVAGLRQFGYSWAEIAARLGVTRQAAQMRWGRHPNDCDHLVTGSDRFVRAAAERTVSARSVNSVQPLFDLSQKGVR
jgi:ribosomal protein S20